MNKLDAIIVFVIIYSHFTILSNGCSACGPNGLDCDNQPWAILKGGLYWAWASPCSGGCSVLPNPLPYGWRRATDQEFSSIGPPTAAEFGCVSTGQCTDTNACAAYVFDPTYDHCDSTGTFVNNDDGGSNEIVVVHDICTPTSNPTPSPTNHPTPSPTNNPTPSPTNDPTPSPTDDPTPSPTHNPTPSPTNNPTPSPTNDPTPSPTNDPTPSPTDNPTPSPTNDPSPSPTNNPTASPTPIPTDDPTMSPTNNPTPSPTKNPTPPTPFIVIKENTPSPTEAEGANAVDDTTTTAQTVGDEKGQQNIIGNNTETDWADLHHIMFYIIICVLLCVIIIGAIFWRRNNQKHKEQLMKLNSVSVNIGSNTSPMSNFSIPYNNVGAQSPRSEMEMGAMHNFGKPINNDILQYQYGGDGDVYTGDLPNEQEEDNIDTLDVIQIAITDNGIDDINNNVPNEGNDDMTANNSNDEDEDDGLYTSAINNDRETPGNKMIPPPVPDEYVQ